MACQLTKIVVQAIENVQEELVQDVHDLAVVLIDHHLQVQPRELCQVPVRVGQLCPAWKGRQGVFQEL